MKIRAFITHKKAEHFIDCQDRFSINPDTKSVALSDGMSTSWQQKLWAEILVNEFTSKDWAPTPEAVKELSPKWKKGVEEFIRELKDKGVSENIIYRNERNLAERKSACATFVGVRFKDDFKWECDVLGDSCLIVKQNKEYEFYTSQEGTQFDSYPDYFDSDDLNVWKKYYEKLKQSNKILLLFGESNGFSEKEINSIKTFFSKFNCVVSVEHMSNLKFESSLLTAKLTESLSEKSSDLLKPDIVITFEGNFCSDYKYILRSQYKSIEHWRVNEDGKIVDVFKSLTTVFECGTICFINKMIVYVILHEIINKSEVYHGNIQTRGIRRNRRRNT